MITPSGNMKRKVMSSIHPTSVVWQIIKKKAGEPCNLKSYIPTYILSNQEKHLVNNAFFQPITMLEIRLRIGNQDKQIRFCLT
jgi:hypothetical protein